MKESLNHHRTIIRRPYSLVEMLVVLAIIAVLVGLGAGGYTAGRRWLSTSKTEALLAKLKIAIESYKTDKGYYPLPHTAPTDTEASVPPFRLDTNAKDFTSGSHTQDKYKPRNNLNNFTTDYPKIQADQSFKLEAGNCYYYYPKDGWNAPLVNEVMLIDNSTTNKFGAIKYRCPGLINKTSFDLYSAGPDRKFAADPTVNIEDDIYAK